MPNTLQSDSKPPPDIITASGRIAKALKSLIIGLIDRATLLKQSGLSSFTVDEEAGKRQSVSWHAIPLIVEIGGYFVFFIPVSED